MKTGIKKKTNLNENEWENKKKAKGRIEKRAEALIQYRCRHVKTNFQQLHLSHHETRAIIEGGIFAIKVHPFSNRRDNRTVRKRFTAAAGKSSFRLWLEELKLESERSPPALEQHLWQLHELPWPL